MSASSILLRQLRAIAARKASGQEHHAEDDACPVVKRKVQCRRLFCIPKACGNSLGNAAEDRAAGGDDQRQHAEAQQLLRAAEGKGRSCLPFVSEVRFGKLRQDCLPRADDQPAADAGNRSDQRDFAEDFSEFRELLDGLQRFHMVLLF